MARMFRRAPSLIPQRISYDNFEPQSEWMEVPTANLLKLYLPGFSKEQVTMTPGTNLNTLKVRGIRPLELKNRYRRFEKEVAIPDNTKVDEMGGNFDNESFIITFPKNIPNGLQDSIIPSKTSSDTKTEQKPDDGQMNDKILSTTHVTISSPTTNQNGEQEATPKALTITDGKRVEERKELADQIQSESETRGHVEDTSAKLMETEGKKKDKDPSLVEDAVPTSVEPKPMSFEDTTSLKDKETEKERVDEKPTSVENVVSSTTTTEQQVPKPKGDEETQRSLAGEFESGTSAVSPPRHRESDRKEKKGKEKADEESDTKEKKGKEKADEPSLVGEISKLIGQHLPHSDVKGKEGKTEKPSVIGSVVSMIEQYVPKSSHGATQDDAARFEEKRHKKETEEELGLKKKHDADGTSEDVTDMTMEDIGAVMAKAKKTLQLEASKLDEEAQTTVSIALALVDVIAAIGAYISHQSKIQRRKRD